MRAVAGVGRDSRCDERPTPRGGWHGGPARAVGRDSRGAASPGRLGRGSDGPSDSATRCRPRRIPAESCSRVARCPGGPTHRPRKRPPRHWRTRRDPLETTWPRVVQWLEAEPHRAAKELFERLQREHPGMFLPGQLRTPQRRVKDWCRLAARRLLFADPVGPSHGAFVLRPSVPAAHERGTEPDAA